MKPSVGRIVRYQHGTGPYAETAAIITAVLPGGAVHLTMFLPGVESLPVVDEQGEPAAVAYADEPTAGHWNWPPRV